MSYHYHYDQLTDTERNVVDQAYREMHRILMAHDYNMRIAGDDTAERVVDEIAKGILDTRVITSKLHLESARERLKGAESLDRRMGRSSV